MPQSYTNLIYHLVYSTKDRQPLIKNDLQPRLYEYIGGMIRQRGGICLAIGGINDHVHILTKLKPDKALSDILRDLKANSTGWMHDVFPDMKDFTWQRGYDGAFTVSSSQVEKVREYIVHQEEHHKKIGSFRDEFIKLLIANEIEFEEKYLWT